MWHSRHRAPWQMSQALWKPPNGFHKRQLHQLKTWKRLRYLSKITSKVASSSHQGNSFEINILSLFSPVLKNSLVNPFLTFFVGTSKRRILHFDGCISYIWCSKAWSVYKHMYIFSLLTLIVNFSTVLFWYTILKNKTIGKFTSKVGNRQYVLDGSGFSPDSSRVAPCFDWQNTAGAKKKRTHQHLRSRAVSPHGEFCPKLFLKVT